MGLKFLLAVAIVWICWRLWRGNPRKHYPLAPPRDAEETAAARATLGVPTDADAAAIRTAHRRLIASAHPDRGGSAEETRRLNAARDRLLKDV